MLEGMMRNMGYGGGEVNGLESVRISDMVPKEEFHTGDQVKCPGVERLGVGVVVELEGDNRLARVNWSGGFWGWWYLKDLKVIGYAIKFSSKSKSLSANSRELVQLEKA